MKAEEERTLRAIIVDDEAPARRKVRRLLELEPDVAVVGEAEDGRAAIAQIREHGPDLVLLDIQMPNLDGFGVIRAVGVERMPHVVFVTAFDEFAIDAFEVNAIDYLLKPVDPDRFRQAIERARTRCAAQPSRDAAARVARLLEAWKPGARYIERLLVETESRTIFVLVESIDWIEAARNYVHLHVGGERHTLRTSIGALHASLDPARFLRINRSQIVRLDSVKELLPWVHGEYVVVLHDGTRLRWGRRYRRNGAAFEPPR